MKLTIKMVDFIFLGFSNIFLFIAPFNIFLKNILKSKSDYYINILRRRLG